MGVPNIILDLEAGLKKMTRFGNYEAVQHFERALEEAREVQEILDQSQARDVRTRGVKS